MTASNWAQFVKSAGLKFRAGVAAHINLSVAVATLRSVLFAPPVTLTAAYTLKPSDSHKVFLLGAGSSVTIPPGLPFYFRAELRNTQGTARNFAIGSGVTIQTFNTPNGTTATAAGTVTAGGMAFIIRDGLKTEQKYFVHGNIG